MKNLATSFLTLAGVAFLATNAIAEDNSATANVFNADMSNPDLAAVITSFQDVCLPFITHKTELPQSANIKHYSERLADQGLIFQWRETKSYNVVDWPAREEWKPPSQQINPETFINTTGEISGPAFSSTKYMTLTHYTGSYVPEQDERKKITLNWNYNSQNYPAKSCEVKMDQALITPEAFQANFIEKDADWQPVSGRDGAWSQCTIDGPDEFEFTAGSKDGALSLSVRRNDFWHPNLCNRDG